MRGGRGLRVVGRKPVLVAALREAKAAEAAAAESEDEETGSGAAAIAALEQMPAAAGDIAELAPTTPQQPQGPKRRRVTAKTEALTPRRVHTWPLELQIASAVVEPH